MAENNENKIRRRKVSSTNLKNTNNNRNTIKNSNNTKNKSKNSRNNKKKSSVQDIKRKQEEKEQFELEREIYYRKKKIKRMEELGTDRLPERKILSSVRHSMERFCRKEVRKDD